MLGVAKVKKETGSNQCLGIFPEGRDSGGGGGGGGVSREGREGRGLSDTAEKRQGRAGGGRVGGGVFVHCVKRDRVSGAALDSWEVPPSPGFQLGAL